jgi:hypothetical protein
MTRVEEVHDMRNYLKLGVVVSGYSLVFNRGFHGEFSGLMRQVTSNRDRPAVDGANCRNPCSGVGGRRSVRAGELLLKMAKTGGEKPDFAGPASRPNSQRV